MKFFSVTVLSIALISFVSVRKKPCSTSATPLVSAVSKQLYPVIGLNLGNQAPEIEQVNPQGKIIKLSSLRGKLVLVDFWASWCGPCRHENPSLVKAYHKFKDKKFRGGDGFTVYGVSLDANGEAWKKAIERDGLVWENHVSDLQGWSSKPAAQYGVNSIPSNFLLNEKGIIIQKDMRGEDLQEVLDKLLIK
ncbi:MAG: TlpA disulfide reductase family protein [bacterium]|nr:TlpA disulfide reductase family protein [bacterium]